MSNTFFLGEKGKNIQKMDIWNQWVNDGPSSKFHMILGLRFFSCLSFSARVNLQPNIV